MTNTTTARRPLMPALGPARGGRVVLAEAAAAMLELWDGRSPAVPDLPTIAARIGVWPAVLAECVPDAEALVAFIIENGLATLNDQCLRAVVQADPDQPLDQIHAVGRAYLEWVIADPRLFRIMTGWPLERSPGRTALRRHALSIRELITRLLRRAQVLGQLRADADLDMIALQGRAITVGLARVIAEGEMSEFYPDVCNRAAIMRALDDFVQNAAYKARL